MFILKLFRSKIFFIFPLLVLFMSAGKVEGQKSVQTPEMSVAGIELGNRESAKKILSEYIFRTGEDGRVTYRFYNKFGTQVMTLTAASAEDRFFITEIEVFAVDQSYTQKHFVARNFGYFVTERGIFIGYRQSAFSMIVGIPNVGREDLIGPKDVVRKKGLPDSRVKEGRQETFTYKISDIQITEGKAAYQAVYNFYKNRLNRFSLKLVFDETSENSTN